MRGSIEHFGCILILGMCLAISGCGSGGPLVVYGTVKCAGKPVQAGDVTFLPVDAAGGPGGGAEIVDGSYRIDGRGGLLPGEYRVVVNAFEKTGRKITQSNGFEPSLVDETRRIGPKEFASAASPLLVAITNGSSNPVDVDLPAK